MPRQLPFYTRILDFFELALATSQVSTITSSAVGLDYNLKGWSRERLAIELAETAHAHS